MNKAEQIVPLLFCALLAVSGIVLSGFSFQMYLAVREAEEVMLASALEAIICGTCSIVMIACGGLGVGFKMPGLNQARMRRQQIARKSS